MVIGLLAGSTDIRGNKSDSNAKFAITPHRCSTVDEGMTNRSSIFAYLVFGPG
jgi:hypothetical protein